MINKILKLKEDNSIWFYILIPILVILGIIKFLSGANIDLAKKELKDTESEDQKLAKKETEYKELANTKLEEAKKQLKLVDTEVDEDWHKGE